MAAPSPTFCAKHPRVETYLRCGRCDTPICPRCLVQTPVGARCGDCARMRRLPLYEVGPRVLARGAAAGLAAAIVAGVVLLVVLGSLRFFGLLGMLLFGGLYGYVVSEAASWATNRKRGSILIWTTVATEVIGLGLARAIVAYTQLAGRTGLDEGTRLARALAAGFSPDLGVLLLLLVAAAVTYNRLR